MYKRQLLTFVEVGDLSTGAVPGGRSLVTLEIQLLEFLLVAAAVVPSPRVPHRYVIAAPVPVAPGMGSPPGSLPIAVQQVGAGERYSRRTGRTGKHRQQHTQKHRQRLEVILDVLKNADNDVWG